MDETRFEVIRKSPQAIVARDIKTEGRGYVVKSVSRSEPLHANIWVEKSAREVANNYRKALKILRRPDFGLAEYVPASRVQEVNEDTVNVVQKEIVGVTLRKHLRGLGEQQADYEETGRVVVPPEVMRQLNDILLKSLQMAIRTTSFPREDLPYGITYRRSEKLPEMRQPQEGEGVMPEVIGENALDNIMVGEDNRLWLTDCAAVCVADKDLAEDGTWRQLHRGLYQYGTDKLLSDEVRQYTHELDRALKGEPLRFLNA